MPDYSFQDVGIEWLRSRPTALLGDEPGLGKTRQLLMAAEGSTLVVAPAMVLDGGVWEDEIAKWRPDLDVTCVAYSSLNEREKTAKGGNRPTDRVRAEYRRHWDTAIFDESHYLKGRKTHWTKGALSIRSDRTFLSTGTPIPNWAYELFTSLQLLFPDEAQPGKRFGSYWRWVKQWFRTWKPPYAPNSIEIGGMKGCDHGNVPICPCWVRFHEENLGDRFLQRLRDDVLDDLPPLTIQEIRVDATPAQRRVYNKLRKEYIAWIEETGTEIVAWNSAALTVKLAKAATGLEILDPDAHGSGKLSALEDIYLDRPRPMLVVGHFRSTVRVAAEISQRRAGRRTVMLTGGTAPRDRRRIVKDFQKGRYDTLCATIDVVAEGLTLTAADTVVRIERSYRPSKNDQVIRRLHRIGQLRPVTVIDLVTKGTIDLHILKLLAEKNDEQMKALRPRDLLALAA